MPKKPSTQPKLSGEEAVELIAQVADRLEAGERSFELQIPPLLIMDAFLHAGHRPGMQLANRIGLQLLAPTMPGNARYAIGQQRLDTPPPFDAASDAAALRAIATELWGPT